MNMRMHNIPQYIPSLYIWKITIKETDFTSFDKNGRLLYSKTLKKNILTFTPFIYEHADALTRHLTKCHRK